MLKLKYYIIILMEFHFIAFWEKSASKTDIFIEIFQILTLRAAASIFFVCLAYWRKIHMPSILTSQAP